MMEGSFSGGYPVVEVPFCLPDLPTFTIECVIDTGFAGYLTLPSTVISRLGLPFFYKMPANLADDSDIMVEVYTATILWHGQERDIEILAMGKRPLVGKALLRGNETCIQFVEGGSLSIQHL